MAIRKLTAQQLNVLDSKATEPPFSGELLHNEDIGEYSCVRCGAILFASEHKFDSGSGWPSFYDVANSQSVKLQEDRSHGMRRIEVVCAKCGGHLGHVFNDAPQTPTNMRFCINSCVLDFKAKNMKGNDADR
jgi:peptide-methionine (R)-S-oxide reductase